MKVFLIWPEKPGDLDLGILISGLKEHSHKLVYWVGHFEVGAAKFSETIFHTHKDALMGLPARGVDINEFLPLGENLIREFYRVESIILTMLNRVVDSASVDERKHLYYHLLRYWFGVLKKYQPDAIIFP